MSDIKEKIQKTGKNQHHIPQTLIKGFSEDKKQIIIYKKDNMYPSSIKRAGSENYFYTEELLNPDNIDRKISLDENEVFSYLDEFINKNHGDNVDPKKATKFILHFSIRSKYLRYLVELSIQRISSHLERELDSHKNLILQKLIDQFTARLPKGVPLHFINEKINEQRGNLLYGFKNTLKNIINLYKTKLPKKLHNNLIIAYTNGELRSNFLNKYKWKIIKSDHNSEFILPDVMILSAQEDGVFPYTYKKSERGMVLFPLSKNTILYGNNTDAEFNFNTFNEHAAKNSLELFMCSKEFSNKNELQKIICDNMKDIIEESIDTQTKSILQNFEKIIDEQIKTTVQNEFLKYGLSSYRKDNDS